MKQFSIFFLVTFLFLSCSSGNGKNKKVDYKIDPEITAEVSKNMRKEGKIDIGTLEIKYYENDSLIAETFSNDKVIPFWIMQAHSPSKIDLHGLVGMFDAWGFQLQITKTKFEVNYFAGADFNIYKKHKSDTSLTPNIHLKCNNTSLTLKSYPKFEDNEEITGIVEFETPEYWTVANGEEKKNRIVGRAYFTTRLVNRK